MRARPALVAGLLVVLAALLLGGLPGTFAVFSDNASVNAGTAPTTAFTSGSIATPATPTVVQQTTTGAAVVSWSATAVSTGGSGTVTADRYEVYRYPSATGGTGTQVCADVTTTSCLTLPPSGGTYYYAVRARFQTNWFQESARRASSLDTTPPSITFARPTDGYVGNDTQLRNHVSCTGGAPACGTATDTGGVASVQYSLAARVSGWNFDVCWNGSGYGVANGDCPLYDTVGTTSWRLPGSETDAYPNGYPAMFTLTVVATDGYGNTTTDSITYRSTG